MPYAYIDDIAVSDIAFHAWGATLEDTFRAAAEATVRVVMTPNPICVTEDAPLESAMKHIKFHRIRRLIVLNKAQEVGGIFTLDDLLDLVAEERQALEAVTGIMRVMRHERL